MATSRPRSYISPSWLAKLLAGEASCEWAAWFRAHNKHDKLPSDFNLARWQADHTELVRTTVAALERQRYQVAVEAQNEFRLQGGQTNAVLSGRPDIVAVRPGQALVVEAKTGKPRASDIAQVMVYMAVMPHIQGGRYADLSIEGRVQYRTHTIDVPAAAVDAEFLARLRRTLGAVGGSEPLRHTPSRRECGMCDIGRQDCLSRIEEPEPSTVVVHGLF